MNSITKIFNAIKEKGIIDFILIILFDLFIKIKYGLSGGGVGRAIIDI
jgi:hypothetical protein